MRRYLSTDASYRELAKEIGCCGWSVRAWVREYREHGMVGKNKLTKKRVSTDKRRPEEKFRLLLEAKGLTEQERGAFLRQEGLHDGDLERWEQEALGGLGGGVRQESQERRVRELERESKKKDKRLKEAAALLELQKKVQALWADEEDDTTPS